MAKKYKTYKFYSTDGRKILTVRARDCKEAWTPRPKHGPDKGYRRSRVGFRPPASQA